MNENCLLFLDFFCVFFIFLKIGDLFRWWCKYKLIKLIGVVIKNGICYF